VRELIALGVAVACAGCALGDAAPSPVLRYPWVEHARVALVEETLTLTVEDEAVTVDGWFRFDGEGALPTRMDFPIGCGDGAVIAFAASMESETGATTALPATIIEPSALPVDGAVEARAIDLPPGRDVRRTRLRVRYRQRVARTFRYVLQSGAYWSGPIRALTVEVRDPERRVASALVEGRAADRVDAGAATWTFVDLEPRGGVLLEVVSPS